MTDKDPEVAALARKAHDIIAERGLHKGDYWPREDEVVRPYNGQAPVCTLGALGVASNLTERSNIGSAASGFANPIAWTAQAILDAEGRGDCHPAQRIMLVGEWNDSPGRTKDHVLGVLDEIATKYAPDEAGGMA